MIVLRKLATSSPKILEPNLGLRLKALEIQKPPNIGMDS
jgi:hypothetical protein